MHKKKLIPQRREFRKRRQIPMPYFILLLLTFSVPAIAGEKADYILLSDPESVLILNKYEQKTNITFPPGAPFRIEDESHLLSDGITSAYKCSFEKKEWFLLPTTKPLSLINNCTVLNDSVRLIRSGIKMRTLDGRTKSIANGSNIIRFFYKASKTYVLSDEFGWVKLPKRSWKRIEKAPAPAAAFPARLRTRILSRMETINNTYQTFFTFFNQKYHKNYKIPRWLYEEKKNSLRLYLNNDETAESLKESFESINSDLQKIVIGSVYQSIRRGNQFLITVRSE